MILHPSLYSVFEETTTRYTDFNGFVILGSLGRDEPLEFFSRFRGDREIVGELMWKKECCLFLLHRRSDCRVFDIVIRFSFM